MARVINLLPLGAADAYVRARRTGILARFFVGVGFLAFIVAVFVAAAWQYLLVLHDAEQRRYAVAAKSAELALATQFEENLQRLTEGLKVLRDLRKPQHDPRILLRDVVDALPAGAVLHTITVDLEATAVKTGVKAAPKSGDAKPTQEVRQTVFLAGKAATRSDVLAYQHVLEALSYIESVEAPTENIIKPVDADFSFLLNLTVLSEGSSVGASSDSPSS